MDAQRNIGVFSITAIQVTLDLELLGIIIVWCIVRIGMECSYLF